MCGIIGWIGKPDSQLASKMRDIISHRGPDDAGEWWDPDRGAWLGHRRLSILDLTPEGHQPMLSPSHRYVISYNGEVFNFLSLREELEGQGFRFRGHSDTEVILAAFDAWGVEKAVKKFVGMFALGLYDLHENALWLIRDRLGIKPLYYACRPGEIAFASELNALKLLPWLNREIDSDALHAYFRYLCVPAPASIIKGARKVLPGTIIRWQGNDIKTTCYWDLQEIARAGLENPIKCSFGDAADELENMLKESIRLRMLSDVPLGAFLSGGVDSSMVAALMQSLSSRPVKTFTIGFSEKSHDESAHAKAVASHIGTDHHEKILTPMDVLGLIPEIVSLYDEPFADGSNVPTFLLSRFAREMVTVALSGDGGDELFGGYPRYFWASRIESWQRRLTRTGAMFMGKALAAVPSVFWDGPVTLLDGHRLAGSEGLSARVSRLGGYLSCPPERVYVDMISAWPNPGVLINCNLLNKYGPEPGRFSGMGWAEQMMATDQTNYLVDDILTKVDRASMAVSLEARVPLLDYRIVEWSWRVKPEFKMAKHGDRGKLLLREVLYRYVPKEIIERPKMGFGMPMGKWLRNELRPWAEELLNPKSIKNCGLLNPDSVQKIWREHLAGFDRLPQLWTVMMFVQWYDRWLKNDCYPTGR